MSRRIRIEASGIQIIAELKDTKTAEAIWEALPIKAYASLWGQEIYFPIPVSLELEEGKEIVDVGDIGYWPQGSAFCIFFGPTPISHGKEIRPASPVSVFGKVIDDHSPLGEITSETEITVERESHGQHCDFFPCGVSKELAMTCPQETSPDKILYFEVKERGLKLKKVKRSVKQKAESNGI